MRPFVVVLYCVFSQLVQCSETSPLGIFALRTRPHGHQDTKEQKAQYYPAKSKLEHMIFKRYDMMEGLITTFQANIRKSLEIAKTLIPQSILMMANIDISLIEEIDFVIAPMEKLFYLNASTKDFRNTINQTIERNDKGRHHWADLNPLLDQWNALKPKFPFETDSSSSSSLSFVHESDFESSEDSKPSPQMSQIPDESLSQKDMAKKKSDPARKKLKKHDRNNPEHWLRRSTIVDFKTSLEKIKAMGPFIGHEAVIQLKEKFLVSIEEVEESFIDLYSCFNASNEYLTILLSGHPNELHTEVFRKLSALIGKIMSERVSVAIEIIELHKM